MNIVVLVKQTFDTDAQIVIKDNKIDDTGVSLIINPYDEFAVEEGIRIREKLGGEVLAIGVNPRTNAALRHALAMGADRAAMLLDDAFSGDPTVIAAALCKYIQSLEYDVILAGNNSIDDQSSQVAPRVSAALGIPIVTGVTSIEFAGDKATCRRETEGGYELVEVQLPAMITAQKGLNEPRYPTMPNIMKSKKKELKTITAADIDFEAPESLTEIIELSMPAPRAAGQIIDGEPEEAVKKLVDLLKNDAKVI